MFVGEIAALGTACLWGLSTYMHTNAAKLIGAWPLTLCRTPLVLFYNICIALVIGAEWVFPSQSIGWILLSGVLGLGIADTLFYEGCTRIGARTGSILWQMTPCVTAVIAFFTLGESLTLLNIAGMLIIIFSVISITTKNDEQTDSPVDPKEWHYGFKLVLLSVLALGLSHVCIRKGLSYGLDPLMGSILRIAAAASCAWIAAAVMGYHHKITERKDNMAKAMKIIFVASFVGTTLGNWVALFSMKYAKAGIAASLISLTPLAIIMITAVHEKKTPSSRVVLGILTACGGSALLFM
ncbi:DMT family transporter [Halodesulfovibrio marinisediminis]|uniref:EamA-like transporter family protein n=1 Tax=Halodesulfovibrio marinisediminis DSM 17456 TaxID=1121457 RepID=A0A1N6H3I7_9BACT|nr:DMT family transporter [Halodesulfovibrio marinisediminis]SIO14237.1 EamA-like transporter family protein [Halodesulfovibrio marinisediminis DSM 17456]